MPKIPDSKPDLSDFDQRLKRAEADQAAKQAGGGRQPNAFGTAFKLATELVVAVCVGVAIGLGLDYVTGYGPLFMLIFFFLGVAAGIKNVVTTAQDMQQAQLRALDETDV